MFLKLGPRKHEFPLAALIPNVLTTLALCSGLAAIHYALKEPDPDWNRALAAVTLAGVFDALDGRAARMLRVTSGFGAVLDSLSDFLAFGVTPAVLLHQWLTGQDQLVGRAGVLSLAAFMVYALAAALRLARFTAEPPARPVQGAKEGVAPYFRGMPSPAAAGIALCPLFLANSRYWPEEWLVPAWGIATLAFVIGLLMVSRIPMFSLKSVRISRRMVAPVLVAVALLAAGMLKDPFLVLALLAGMYAISVPVTAVLWWRVRAPAPGGEHAPVH